MKENQNKTIRLSEFFRRFPASADGRFVRNGLNDLPVGNGFRSGRRRGRT